MPLVTKVAIDSAQGLTEAITKGPPIANSEYGTSRIESTAWNELPGAAATPTYRSYALVERMLARLFQARISRIAVGYMLALILAESITNLVDPVAGASLHFLIFTAAIVHGAVDSRTRAAALWLSIALVPLIRVISLGLPLGAFGQEWWYLLTGIPLLAAATTAIRAIGYTRQQVGLCIPARGRWILTMVVAASGLVIGLGEYVILGPTPIFDGEGVANLLFYASVLLVGTGMTEELIFRGPLQTATTAALGLVPGFVLVSGLFALMHMGHGSALNVLYIFGVSMYLCYARYLTGSLIGVVLAHSFANIVLYVVMT